MISLKRRKTSVSWMELNAFEEEGIRKQTLDQSGTQFRNLEKTHCGNNSEHGRGMFDGFSWHITFGGKEVGGFKGFKGLHKNRPNVDLIVV